MFARHAFSEARILHTLALVRRKVRVSVARESVIEQRHRLKAMKLGWFVEKIKAAGRAGFPDRVYIKGGRVVFVEWKKHDGRLSPIQKHRIEQMRAAGAEVYVVYSIEEADAVLGI